MKLHALPLSPPPPPAPPVRASTQTTTPLVQPFQLQPAIDAVQSPTARRNSADTRSSSTAQAKQSAGRVATQLLDPNDPGAGQRPYRRGALVDISA